MNENKLLVSFISGALLMALGSSAKAIVDVQVLKKENETILMLLQEVRGDVKDIRETLVHQGRK
jgi:hypothetical protein